MRNLFLTAGVVAILGGLSACADGYGYRHGYVGADVAYAGPAPVGYDGFYDDYYGPFYDGYWGNDGFFYYSTGEGRGYQRDDRHHFAHEAGPGMHEVHGRGPRGGGGSRGGDDHHR